MMVMQSLLENDEGSKHEAFDIGEKSRVVLRDGVEKIQDDD